MDIHAVPLGERALQGVLDHVLAIGDEAETSYLEVKSTLDLKAQLSIAKIAKFLLGAANRRPQQAARHFQGFAVLVIGAEKGRTQGVPRGTEPHELEDRLRPYLGPQFPAFEFGRITVNSDKEVIFIVAQPPRDGQSIFPCFKNFQGDEPKDNLVDGAIYYRATSNSRFAKAGEVLDLVERARGGGKPPVKLSVEVLGTLRPVNGVEDMLSRLYMAAEEVFLQKSSKFEQAPSPNSAIMDIVGRLGPSPSESRARQLAVWKRNRSKFLSEGKSHFLGVALDGVAVRVLSEARFIARPQLLITFHGCEAFAWRSADEAKLDRVVEPVQGRNDPYIGLDLSGIRPRDYPVDWAQRGENAEVTITPESFRPNVPWISNQDDFVLLPHVAETGRVRVTWTLTEDGSDEVTEGELEVALAAPLEAAAVLGKHFIKY